MFLVGSCGPLRRWIALHDCSLVQREVEYLYLTRDSSESDLKQRREITSTGSSSYESQSVVEAAVHDRVLILEGLENAVRNVLPVLNNPLENREMALEDGRFLVSPQRYEFMRAEVQKKGLEVSSAVQTPVSAHANFRVIAISIPVPPLRGNPLDPPLRSRFQSRSVDSVPSDIILQTLVESIGSSLPMHAIETMLSFYEAIRSLTSKQASMAGVENRTLAFQHLSAVNEIGLLSSAQLLTLFPVTPVEDAPSNVFPWQSCITNEEAREMVARIWQHLVAVSADVLPPLAGQPERKPIVKTRADGSLEKPAEPVHALLPAFETDPSLGRFLLTGARRPDSIIIRFDMSSSGAAPKQPVFVRCRGGSGSASGQGIRPPVLPKVWTGGFMHHYTLNAMLQSHTVGRDLCLIGGKGEGKFFLVQQFASLLGYVPVQAMFLYKDMTARDLVQRRTTTSTGATVWQSSPLIDALHSGSLAVLDGVDWPPCWTLSIGCRSAHCRSWIVSCSIASYSCSTVAGSSSSSGSSTCATWSDSRTRS
jgi:hypothetical protein